ncbi:MAG TPA: hypothetical protein EYN91_20715 [Candidatus Melainabacteria bacterium]|jgi:ferredoxin|nr:hypothetical protein [Candidatus Melainabacteria bacterium]HIN63300.1 hypothetical protein [Candidatus Obscuribacterales bacterium]
MLFPEKENEFEVYNETVINLTSQVTDNELEQLLSNKIETAAESCPGGVCQLNWRPTRRNQAA